MKKAVLLLFSMLFITLGLTGCSNYHSSYSSVAHVHSNDSDSGWVSFVTFNGIEVFKFKNKSGKTAKIQYSGKLEEGSLTAYYDCGKGKTELFSLQGGEKINASSNPLTSDTIYVIIETSEKCENGDFGFELIYD